MFSLIQTNELNSLNNKITRNVCQRIIFRCFGVSKHEWEPDEMPIKEYGSKNAIQRVYGWGLATSGALGVRDFVTGKHHRGPLKRIMKPCQIPIPTQLRPSMVACGFGFTVFARKSKENDKLMGCGLNTNSQLGFHPLKKRQNESWQWLIEATPIPLPIKNLKTTQITHIGCGRAHTIVATNDEGIFSLGNNAHGQCGRQIIENENYENNSIIHKVQGIEGFVRQVVCGLDHTLILTEDGKVYAFGTGTDGQLGNNSYLPCWQPTLVKGDIEGEKIIQVSSAADTILAISENGEVFGWGNSEYKQFAKITNVVQLNISKHLPFKLGRIISVAAAGSMCALVNDKGNVYVWGYGLLGQGPDVTAQEEPSLIPSPIFGQSEELNPDSKVKTVVPGLHCMAAITDKGLLYTWGKNQHGILGLGHEKDQYFPFKVSLFADVKQLSCGAVHMATICSPWI